MPADLDTRRSHQLLIEVINWIMDGEPLTTLEEREQYEKYGFVAEDTLEADPKMTMTLCLECRDSFAQPVIVVQRCEQEFYCPECRGG